MGKHSKNDDELKIGGITVKKEVFKFAKADWDKYKKKNEDDFDSKKEMKLGYGMYLVDCVPEALDFVIRYGHINNEEIQEYKTKIYRNLSDEKFINALSREIKEGSDIKKRVRLLPIAYKEIMQVTQAHNDSLIAANPNAQIIPMDYIVEFVQLLLKKKLKKAKSLNIPESLAFDVLCVIPHEDAVKYSQFYRIHSLYDLPYERSKSMIIPFNEIVELIGTDDIVSALIVFALLERKEKFSKLTDSQKSLYLEISNWCFDMMNNKLDSGVTEAIIKMYIKNRKKDEAQGRDSNRRYALTSLSADDYPKISKIVQKIISDDSTLAKYFN